MPHSSVMVFPSPALQPVSILPKIKPAKRYRVAWVDHMGHGFEAYAAGENGIALYAVVCESRIVKNVMIEEP